MELRYKRTYSALPEPRIQSPSTQWFPILHDIQSHVHVHGIVEIENDTETNISASSESTATTIDPMLPTQLHHAGVRFRTNDARAPDDMRELLQHLHKERRAFTDEEAQAFPQRLENSSNEEVFKSHFVTVILNPPSRRLVNGYSVQMDLEWTAARNKLPTAEGLQGFQNPKPDYFETFNQMKYPFRALNDLNWSLSPCLLHPIAMPIFCVEFKSPEKGLLNGIKQAAHDGAVMVHAAWDRHKFMKRPANEFIGKTKALVIVISGTQLIIFACHAAPPNWDHQGIKSKKYPTKLHYHIYRLTSSELLLESDLKTADRLIKNAQDWCYSRAESEKHSLWTYFNRLEEEKVKSFAEEREMYDTKPRGFGFLYTPSQKC